MSSSKMLIDATHPEETRVVVLRGSRVEEFDYESAARKVLRGNIFLAKVTRVEPSLQAAFVDYGGNRHGFLAFNEIHPDYYQIPVADRQALIEEEAAAEAAEEAEADAAADKRAEQQASLVDVTPYLPPEGEASEDASEGDSEQSNGRAMSARPREDDKRVENVEPEAPARAPEPASEHQDEHPGHAQSGEPETSESNGAAEDAGGPDAAAAPNGAESEQVDSVGTEDALEEVPNRPRRRQRSYKIQEVIKRRQVILVQVVKEERGSKGAALTTYLSLAGRYTVLMPNTARGGGISRKITNAQDRKRLKAIAQELEVPEGIGLIIRTAGASRTKQEIKRDFECLLRLWENVRDLTLQSTAPSLVYEEGDLIKRSIRDLYSKDIDEIVVAGETAHRDAKDFMRMLMPSHVKNVILYSEPEPLFNRYQIERQLNAMFSPYVHLKSGGYLVVNQTEALVAIDVNSGKSTREFSIEETALNTNLEAADEIARQLKLRDLAGLIVIDFIDMEEKRNNRAVERRIKEALRFDRARIQVGHISHFGLLEMSRQRLRSGVLERSTSQCPHCQGTGIIRSTESVALAVLRGIEDALMAGPPASMVAKTTANVALFLLNNKRAFVNEIEARHGISIVIQASEKLQGANFTLEKAPRAAEPQRRPERSAVNMDWGFEGESPEEAEEEVVAPEPEAEGASEDGDGRRSRRRRRRGRRGDRPHGENGAHAETTAHDSIPGAGEQPDFEPAGHDEEREEEDAEEHAADLEEGDARSPEAESAGEGTGERRARRGRRRGRRGGRRDREQTPRASEPTDALPHDRAPIHADDDERPAVPPAIAEAADEHRRPRHHEPIASEPAAPERSEPPAEVKMLARPANVAVEPTEERPQQHPVASEPVDRPEPEHQPTPPPAPARNRRTAPVASEPVIERVVVRPNAGTLQPQPDESTGETPVRRGWWQRKFGAGQ